ncbi:MAG: hypothetical protein IPO17_10520 [Flavobacteriales bacterium]|nr:hypothetical protein [Flavobacteriales bacterium]
MPFLHDPITWRANVKTGAGATRTDSDMQLLQIDIAVKDQRSPIGWVFGTFVYDGHAAAANRWDRMKLVGLSWGNDPGVATMLDNFTAFVNPDIEESFLNPAVIGDGRTHHRRTRVPRGFGWSPERPHRQ